MIYGGFTRGTCVDEGVLLQFWGKSRGGVHPALYHMIDVGMVARAMATRNLRTATRGLLDASPATLGYWVALHDLGKISPGFQAKAPPLLREVEQSLGPDAAHHGTVESNHALVTLAALGSSNWSRALAAHHGAFPLTSQMRRLRLRIGSGVWAEAREAARAALREVFGLDDEPPTPDDPAAAMVLAGLTAVSDWIGSDDRWFPRCDPPRLSLAAYAVEAQARAEQALAALGWDPWQADARPLTFEDLWPFRPSPLQERAIAHAAEPAAGPQLAIIEAPMGRGKTEAALWLADRWLASGQHTGLYFALPTQATSGAMLKRVKAYAEARFAGQTLNLHLLHGLAAFDETYEALTKRGTPDPAPADVYADDAPTNADLIAASWFRGAKLGLLSPFAVGTIDQALFGVLQTRHQFVRLLGLAGKVVILDEVHAYDAYTTGLLERLVEWLRALGCSVVLLSATLPAAKREGLLRAWGAATPAGWSAYPRLTTVVGGQVRVEAIPPEPVSYELKVLSAPDGQPTQAAAADLLAGKLEDGGCAAWICSTVARAQKVYRRLQADPRFAHCELLLFHARFPVARRAQIEAEVRRRFGPPTDAETQRPHRAILVATQVVEQSLDLDFDVMVSDPAPIDLLLQRAGRLHRHKRDRPAGLELPELLVLGPAKDEPLPDHLDAAAWVYERAVLMRTMVTLDGDVTVGAAADLERLVEAVYGPHEPAMPDELADTYAEARAKAESKQAGHEQLAAINAICGLADDDPLSVIANLPDDPDDPSIARIVARGLTRLGEESVLVVCAEGDVSGWSERELVSQAVRLNSKDWVRHFIRQPSPWPESAVLRHYRLAQFGHGRLMAEAGELVLHGELGVVSDSELLLELGTERADCSAG